MISFKLFCTNPSTIFRSSHRRCCLRKAVLKNFVIFTAGKQLWWNLFFNKVVDLQGHNFIKKKLERRCFPKNLVKYLRTTFLPNTSGGCFCRQNRYKTRRYSKKIDSTNIFVETNLMKVFFDYEILSFRSHEKPSWKNVPYQLKTSGP